MISNLLAFYFSLRVGKGKLPVKYSTLKILFLWQCNLLKIIRL